MGVAILANAPERIKEKREERSDPEPRRPLQLREPRDPRADSRAEAAARLRRAIKKLEEDDQPHLVRLGDASVAAPFTSRLSSILCSEYFFSNMEEMIICLFFFCSIFGVLFSY